MEIERTLTPAWQLSNLTYRTHFLNSYAASTKSLACVWEGKTATEAECVCVCVFQKQIVLLWQCIINCVLWHYIINIVIKYKKYYSVIIQHCLVWVYYGFINKAVFILKLFFIPSLFYTDNLQTHTPTNPPTHPYTHIHTVSRTLHRRSGLSWKQGFID